MKIILSIIIPVYNLQDYIESCVNSIVSCNVDKRLYEIIVLNDGSSDDSLSVINEISDSHKDVNIIIVNNVNKGVSQTRNEGIELATGKYIWFIDGDDTIDNESLPIILDTLKKEVLDILYFRMQIKTENLLSNKSDIPYPSNKLLKGWEILLSGFIPTSSCCIILNKEFLTKNYLFFNKSLIGAEDVDFMTRVFVNNPVVMSIDEAFYYYYQRPDSCINSKLLTKIKQRLESEIILAESFKDILSDLKDKNQINYFKERINLIVISLMISLYRERRLSYDYVYSIIKKLKEKNLYHLKVNIGSFKRKIMWLFANFESLYFLLIEISRKKQ